MKKQLVILVFLLSLLSTFSSAIEWYTPVAQYYLDGNYIDQGPAGRDLEGNQPTYVSAIVGSGGDFESTNSEWGNFNGSENNYVAIRTIDLWWKAETDNAGGVLISITDRSDSGNNRFTIQQEGIGNIRFRLQVNGSQLFELDTTGAPCTNGVQCHIVGVINGTTAELWINNVSQGQDDTAGFPDEQFDTISVCNRDQATPCDGVIDNVWIGKVTYTQENVSISYNVGNGQNFTTLSPVSNDIIQDSLNHTTARDSGNETIWRTAFNLTSEGFDSTPTVAGSMLQAGNCSISTLNFNHSEMIANDINTTCASVDSEDFVCTLPTSKKANLSTTNLYIACTGDTTSGPNATANLSFKLNTVEFDWLTWNVSNSFANGTIWRGSSKFDTSNRYLPVRMRNGEPFVEVNTTVVANCSISTLDANHSTQVADDATTYCTGDDMNIQHDCSLPASKMLSTGDNRTVYLSCVGLDGESVGATSGPLNLTRDRLIEVPVLIFNETSGGNYSYTLGANVTLKELPSEELIQKVVSNSTGIAQFFLTTGGRFTACSHINETVRDVCSNDIIVS